MLAAALVCIALSAIAPYDWITWWLEAAPVLIGIPILLATYRRHRLTPLLYRLIFLHMLVLLLGLISGCLLPAVASHDAPRPLFKET